MAAYEDLFKNSYRRKYELCPRLIDLNRHVKVRDEIVSVFISAMMGHIVKSWEAVPCIEKKFNPRTSTMTIQRESNSSLKIDASEDEQRTSSFAVLEEGLKKSNIKTKIRTVSKLISDNSFGEIGDLFSSSEQKMYRASISNLIPDYAAEWIAVSTDPSLLTNDWRFYEGDQIAIIEFKNGNKFRGRLSRNVMHGEGEFQWANGPVYKGTFNCGDITGKGQIRWPDTSWYDGEVYYGYRHGKGLLVLPKFLAYYGDWVQGIRHGEGLLLYDVAPFKNCYDVNWDKGVCSGNGLRVYPSGSQYDGQWKNGRRDGYGIMIWSNGDVYIGDWVKGKMQGIGKYVWRASMMNDFVLPARNSYYGTWFANSKHGVGILETISGVCIKGEWKLDLKNGYGELICRNGIRIEKNPLFIKDHLNGQKFNDEHPWVIMMKLDNTNIMKHNAGYTTYKEDTDKNVKKSKPSESNKDLICPESDNVLHPGDSIGDDKNNLLNIKFNPSTVTSEYIDLLYYLIRLRKNFEVTKSHSTLERNNNNTKLFDELTAPQLKIRIHRTSVNSVKKYEEFDPKEPLKFYSFESKWVRNVILRHLPFLKKLYNDYAAMLCVKRPNYALLLPRLLLWQMFRDFNIQKKGIVIQHLDLNVRRNPASMIEDAKSPFEKIKFFQFIHYLVELSWEMYGKYNIGLDDTPGILASAIEKLIEEDIKSNARNHNGISLLIYRDLLPLNDLYDKLYCKYNVDTTRKFLAMILEIQPKSTLFSCYKEAKNEEIRLIMSDVYDNRYKNIYDIGDQPKYKKMKLKSWSQLNDEKTLIPVDINTEEDYEQRLREIGDNKNTEAGSSNNISPMQTAVNDDLTTSTQQNVHAESVISPTIKTSATNIVSESKRKNEDAYENDISKYTLKNLTLSSALECIHEVCPTTKSGNLIVNIDYNITFLEFYEMLILCALKSIEIDKARKEKILQETNENNKKENETTAERISKTVTKDGKKHSTTSKKK